MRAGIARLLSFFSSLARRVAGGRAPSTARLRKQPRRPAGKPPYDLAKDASTDNQKYLM